MRDSEKKKGERRITLEFVTIEIYTFVIMIYGK